MAKKRSFFGFLKKLKPEKITSMAAIAISVCALIATIYQTYILKQQQHASVWPRLSLLHSWHIQDDKSHYLLSIENVGTGPAIIHDVTIQHKNKKFKNFANLASYTAKLKNLTDSLAYQDNRDLFKDLVIPQNDKWTLLLLNHPDYIQHFVYELKNIKVEVVYSSLYGERFKVTYPVVSHEALD